MPCRRTQPDPRGMARRVARPRLPPDLPGNHTLTALPIEITAAPARSGRSEPTPLLDRRGNRVSSRTRERRAPERNLTSSCPRQNCLIDSPECRAVSARRVVRETSFSASSNARAASSLPNLRACRRPSVYRQRTSQPPRWKLTLIGTSTVGRKQTGPAGNKKAPLCGALPVRPRGLEPPGP